MLAVGGVVAEVMTGQDTAKKNRCTYLERGQQGKAMPQAVWHWGRALL